MAINPLQQNLQLQNQNVQYTSLAAYYQQQNQGGVYNPYGTQNASYGLQQGWAGYSGGLTGIAGVAGGTTVGIGIATAGYGYSYPGTQALGTVGAFGAQQNMQVDNLIEVAGTGMGADKKYKMYAGEALAVSAVLKEKDSQSPEDLQKSLKDKYGIDAEIKDVDGHKALVNKATGNTIMVDGNGNNIMEQSDMKFDDALKEVKDRFGIDVDGFANRYDITKGGIGAQTGNYNNFTETGAFGGLLNSLGSRYGTGNQEQSGVRLWGDPLWENTIMQIFAKAMNYSNATF